MKKYLAAGIVFVCLMVIGVVVFSRYVHKTTKPAAAPKQSYVALGDSVAAGLGLPTDSDSSACNRTNESYPQVVAKTLDMNVTNLACSGATILDGVLGSQTVNQLALPSQIHQLLALPRPALISLTVGANDVNWTSFIRQCYLGTCGSDSDTAGVQAKLTDVASNLKMTLDQLQAHYNSVAPHVVVTGYYQVMPATPATCSDLQGVDASEMAWVRDQQTALSNTIKDVVGNYHFAAFAPIDFSRHELCSGDPWVQGLNDKAPYHPTAEGQNAIAKQVIAANKTLK